MGARLGKRLASLEHMIKELSAQTFPLRFVKTESVHEIIPRV